MALTRTAVARYLTSQPSAQRRALRQTAAWLISAGQTRRSGELVMEVARLQAEEGRVWAKVSTARPLSDSSRRIVEAYLKEQTGARELELETVVVPGLIGGLKLETPDREIDLTIDRRLRRLTQEGAS